MNATAELYFEHHDRIEGFARSLVGQEAEDLVQEAFLKAHRHLNTGGTIRAPVSFLFATVRNLVNDRYREKHVDLADVDVEGCIASDGLSVERTVMSDREFEALVTAISQLPPRIQEAFVLRKVYGYSCQEISDHMGTSIWTIKKQATVAFKRLSADRRESE